MRLLGSQTKTRTLILTAAVPIFLGIMIAMAWLKSRSTYYNSRAIHYASKEKVFAKHIEDRKLMAADSEEADHDTSQEAKNHSGAGHFFLMAESALFRTQTIKHDKDIARFQAKMQWYATMRAKYQFACSHPWVSVPPDPSEPK